MKRLLTTLVVSSTHYIFRLYSSISYRPLAPALLGLFLCMVSPLTQAQTGITSLDWRSVSGSERSLFFYGPGLSTVEPRVTISENARAAGRSEWVCWRPLGAPQANACMTRQTLGQGFMFMRVTAILSWLKRGHNFNFETIGSAEEYEAPVGEIAILRSKIQFDTTSGQCEEISPDCSSAPIKNCFVFHQMGSGNMSFLSGYYCAASGSEISNELLKKMVSGIGAKDLGVASVQPIFGPSVPILKPKHPLNNKKENNEEALRLGFLYSEGRGGVVKDLEKAVEWFSKAAENGNVIGQYQLGQSYRAGSGITQNDSEAVKWYRKAAKQGDKLARKWVIALETKIAATSTQSAERERQEAEAKRKEEQRIAAKRKEEERRVAEVRRQEAAEDRRKEEERRVAEVQRQTSEAKAQRQKEAEKTKRITKAQQTALGRLGLYDGAIDGIAGPKTNQALKRWQTSRGYSGELSEQQTAELIDTAEQYAATPKVAEETESQTEALRLAEEAKLQVAEEKRKREAAERRLAELKAKEAARKSAEAKPKPKPTPQASASTSGSGFFVSKTGHVITNQHVVADCKKVTVGDKADKQVQADVLEKDARNDLALLKISSLKMASAETKSLIQKLGLTVVPLASDGLLRSDDVDLGEDVLVAGYPYGEIFGDAIKVTKGIVSSNRGMGDDITQFQIDAAVQPGNSGGPIYDQKGNIVGVVVSQLNKVKFAKMVGSIPENVNFGIKASTVRQFLSSSGLPSKWATRSKRISTRDLAKIAKNQAVMVVCQK